MNQTTPETYSGSERAVECDQMRREVLAGLAQPEKFLPSKYLYDARGAKLFERICELDEYYVTRVETAILREHASQMAERLGPGALVIEPGSGSGIKTRMLLEALRDPAGYVPVDISCEQLYDYANGLRADYPELDVRPLCADFTDDLDVPETQRAASRRVVYFPGSTIGNFSDENAIELLRRMRDLTGDNGAVLIGVDLKKDRALLEAAYDDSEGLSAAFALNVLERLNRELAADFDLDEFSYLSSYSEQAGRIEMYIVSERQQRVCVAGKTIELRAGERIRTEYSRKFSID